MMNKVILEGRVVRDMELKTSGDVQYVLGTIAITINKEKSEFIGFSSFGKTAELLSNYAHKGDLISVEGYLNNIKKDDKYYLCLTVNQVHFLSKKQEQPKPVYNVEG